MNQPESPPSTGLVAGKYQLVQMIGRGGMGSVWEARHASLGTRFAIKFIEAEYADSQEARSRFDREARAAATIQSKHAIQIFDHGVTEDGKPYIVMELLEGEPLDKRIDRLGRLSLVDTTRILQQVCRGLARAHERGIVHRDLKPENIFLVRTPEDDEEIAKLLDFGIAKVSNSPHNPGVTSSTKTGAVLGTPFYMSPEQARGLRNVDHRTDVWSLGVIAFKCVTGKLPFDGESVGDLLVKICTSPIPVPSQAAPGLPPSFDAWFMRALEREPDRRFSNVQELAEALAHAAGIAPRSSIASANHGLAQLPTVGAASGPGAVVATPAPGHTPFSQQAGYSGQTPQPAAMTNAPFTSSQPVRAPSTGKGKLVLVTVLVAGVLFAATFVAVTKLAKKDVGVGLTAAASTPSSVTSAPPSAEHADKPSTEHAETRPEPDGTEKTAEPTAAAATTPVAAKTAPAAGAKPPTHTTTGGKTSATKPTGGKTTTTTTAPATTTTSTPTPAKKKPDESDPGY